MEFAATVEKGARCVRGNGMLRPGEMVYAEAMRRLRVRTGLVMIAVIASIAITGQTRVNGADSEDALKPLENAANTTPAFETPWLSAALIKRGTGEQRHVAGDNAPIYSKDQLEIEVTLASEGYLYLLYQTKSGSIRLLHPAQPSQNRKVAAGQHRLLPIGLARVPFTPDDELGPQTFFVVAGRGRLPTTLAALVPLLEGEKRGRISLGGAEGRRPRSPPGRPETYPPRAETGARTLRMAPNRLNRPQRGQHRRRADGGFVDALPDDAGIAIVPLAFDLRPSEPKAPSP